MNLVLRSALLATLATASSLWVSAEESPEDLIVSTEAQAFDVSPYYNEGETRGSFDMIMKPYEIPLETTTYIDFLINLPEDLPDLFHVVWGEVINTQPEHLHHYVLMGCRQKVDADIEGFAVGTDFAGFSCVDQLGIWAPGANVFGNFDMDTGFLLGRGLGFEALRLNVHYTDGVYADEALKTMKVAEDGIRVHYTTDFRPYSSMRKQVINIFEDWGGAVVVPANEKRWYMTRTCKVGTSCKDAPPEKMRILGFMAGAMGLDTGIDSSMFENLTCGMVAPFCNMGGELGSYVLQVCPATCGLCDDNEDGSVNPLNPGKYRVAGVHYHAHIVGREMYATLLHDVEGPAEETAVQVQKQVPDLQTITTATDLESRDFWFYEDQAIIPFNNFIETDNGDKVRGVEIQPGDRIQTTCVYDSSWKEDPTRFDLATYDEMCIIALRFTFETPASLFTIGSSNTTESTTTTTTTTGLDLFSELRLSMFTCDDDEETHVHTGVLAEGEEGRDIWKNHPIAQERLEKCTYPVMDFLFLEAQPFFFQEPQCPEGFEIETPGAVEEGYSAEEYPEDHSASNAGAREGPEGCYDVSVHQCKCDATSCSKDKCEAQGMVWTAGCSSLSEDCACPEGLDEAIDSPSDEGIMEAIDTMDSGASGGRVGILVSVSVALVAVINHGLY